MGCGSPKRGADEIESDSSRQGNLRLLRPVGLSLPSVKSMHFNSTTSCVGFVLSRSSALYH